MGFLSFLSKSAVWKLHPADNSTYKAQIAPMIVEGEEIVCTYKTIRDGVVFTNMRLFVIDVQGVTGKRVSYDSIPYNKIKHFSVETAGTLDIDSQLVIYISDGIAIHGQAGAFSGVYKFEFNANSDIATICHLISSLILTGKAEHVSNLKALT